MKCLMSGSHSFIGRHLAQNLEQLGHIVVPIYNEKLESLDYLSSFIMGVEPDYIFNLASFGNM